MASTYLSLCNQVLRRLNEVEIVASEFADVVGVQALVKDAVKAAVARLSQQEYEWPFNAASHTQVLTAGTTEYSWPASFKAVDWNSFQVQEDTTLGSAFKSLRFMERDEWYRNHRDDDYRAGSAGRGIPDNVFPSHGSGFGVTISPNAAYSVVFKYYLDFSTISAFDDVTRIPTSFDPVLVDGALYHMYLFKDNTENAQAAFLTFEQGLKNLQSIYINNYASISDTRIRF
tara:strand:- start:402 stop:1091 length:690 start_codon:yes stop_codon:yes gene_type:complete